MIALIVGLGALAAKGVGMILPRPRMFPSSFSGMEEFMVDITGEEGRWLFPLAGFTVFLYVFIGNPDRTGSGFFPANRQSEHHRVHCPCRDTFTHVIGIKYHGAVHQTFPWAVWWIGPLIFIIEIIGHFARILSLSFRLFGNMMGHEIVLAKCFSALPAFRTAADYGPGYFCRVCSGVCIFSVVNYLFLRGHGACPLMRSDKNSDMGRYSPTSPVSIKVYGKMEEAD
ncbi:MAG: F0F1 ATP synthase subunit A [Desulfobacterales bacterium]